MRFWPSFHRYSLDFISFNQNKLVLRTPSNIRLRLLANHLEPNHDPGSTFTHYNYETCLWDCYHSPKSYGHHCLVISIMDIEEDEPLWLKAVRIDMNVKEKPMEFIYPTVTPIFNRLRWQLIQPFSGILSRENVPAEIIVRVPDISEIQLQIDDQTLIKAQKFQKDIYQVSLPSTIPKSVNQCHLMGLCSNQTYYSIFLIFKIE